MRQGKLSAVSHSIGFRLYATTFLCVLPIIFFLFFNNSYAIGVVRTQVAKSEKSNIALYMSRIDSGLRNAQLLLVNIAANDSHFQTLKYVKDQDSRTMAKIALINTLSNYIMIDDTIDMFYVHPSKGDHLITVGNAGNDENTVLYFQNYLNNLPDGQLLSNQWKMVNVRGDYYLFLAIRYGTADIGAWTKVKNLLDPVRQAQAGKKGTFLFADENGDASNDTRLIRDNHIALNVASRHYYMAGNREPYLVIGQKSQNGSFGLMELIPDSSILQGLPYLTQTSKFLIIILALVFTVAVFMLRSVIFKPIGKIVHAMQDVQKGNLDARLREQSSTREFQIVSDTFNDMMDQIKTLKISVYEEKLSIKKAELKQLRLQINPHFFMNALNITYNLALAKDYELVKEMTICLIKYFQFMSYSGSNDIPLKKEFEHVDYYLRIQRLRFPDSFTYALNAPDSLLQTPVPPLVVMTFVENTMKHALTIDNCIHLSVKACDYEDETGRYLKLEISDTGKGFSEAELAALNNGENIPQRHKDHIGIWNIRHTLDLTYSGKAKIDFSNNAPSGARISIQMPVNPLEGGERSEGDV